MRRERRAIVSAKLDDAPLILVEKERGALRIAALDRQARRSGLQINMMLAAARARVPELRVAAMDRRADAEFLARCVGVGEFFTPLVAIQGDDGLILDITGCAHLFGGEAGLLEKLRHKFARLGLSLRAATGRTPDAASVRARFGTSGVVAPDAGDDDLRALPVMALGMATETSTALIRAGLKTLGDLEARPSTILSARFGMDLVTRLHRILGREDLRISPERAVPDCIAERRFPEPLLHADALLAALESLVDRIVAMLERRGLGGWLFEASFFRSDGVVRRITLETAQGSRNPASLMRLFRLRLDTLKDPLDPGFGFDAIRLSVLKTEALTPAQQTLDGREPGQDGDMVELVDRLVARFGRDRVLRFVARDTHDPVRAAAAVAVGSAVASATWPAPPAGEPPARPLQLFEPPQVIETLAEVPDGPPLRFRWRRVLHDVARAEGPERIAPEWWLVGNSPPATRDYYRVEDTQGRRFWVFREGFYTDKMAPRWFMHGLFA